MWRRRRENSGELVGVFRCARRRCRRVVGSSRRQIVAASSIGAACRGRWNSSWTERFPGAPCHVELSRRWSLACSIEVSVGLAELSMADGPSPAPSVLVGARSTLVFHLFLPERAPLFRRPVPDVFDFESGVFKRDSPTISL